MGMTGYLLLRKELEGGSDSANEVVLYETKAFVPFAWNVLFSVRDVRRIGPDLVLAARRSAAIALARTRLPMLKPLVTAKLHSILDRFVRSIESADDGWLVLDPYRIVLAEDELTEPIRWFDAPAVDSIDTVFGDDDGVELDDDERIEVGDVERVAGWTVSGDVAPWIAEASDADDES